MPDDQPDPDHEWVQKRATDRQQARDESVESMLGRVGLLDESNYPVTTEELADDNGTTQPN